MTIENRFAREVALLLLAVGAVLAVPLLAMRVTDEVAWTASDFVVAGALLLGTGFLYLVARRGGGRRYRLAAGLGLFAALFLVWANLAVGVIGDEGNPANAMYLLVLAIGGIGALLARGRAAGLARTFTAMAVAQSVIAAIAIAFGLGGAVSGPVEIVWTNGLFVALFGAAAYLFASAAGARGPQPDAAAAA